MGTRGMQVNTATSSSGGIPKDETKTSSAIISRRWKNETRSSSSFSDTQQWWNLQSEVCPNNTPGVRFARRIFELARKELGLSLNEDNHDDKGLLPKVFFEGFFWNVILYLHGNDGNRFNRINENACAVIYIPIWKCGNTQIRHGLKSIKEKFGGKLYDEEMVFGTRTLKFASALNRIRKIQPNQQPCIVTAVRDPISHFLSAYNEIEFRYHNQLTGKIPPWNGSHKDGTHLLIKQLEFPNQPLGSRERFESFVRDILSEKAILAGIPAFKHVFSSSRILAAMSQWTRQQLTGYLPTTANLTTEWPRFLSRTCPCLPKEVDSFSLPVAGLHSSTSDPHGTYQAAKDVWNDEGPFSRALCVLRLMDYACFFSDLPKSIPELCQDVYANIHPSLVGL